MNLSNKYQRIQLSSNKFINGILRVHLTWLDYKIPILISFLVFQVKFSELTLDMFRMLQALEREPEEVPPRTLVTTNEVSESPSDKVSPDQVYYKMKYIFCEPRRASLDLIISHPRET